MIKTAVKFCAIASNKKADQNLPYPARYITIKSLENALHLQATDGHRVHSIKCYVAHNLPVGTIIKVLTKDLENAVKEAGRRKVERVSLNLLAAPITDVAPQAERENRRMTLHLPDAALSVEYFVSDFDPLHEWSVRQPLDADPVELIGFDTGLLADAHKAFKMLKPVHGAVRFEFNGTRAGALLTPKFQPTVPALYDACIVIIPCRVD